MSQSRQQCFTPPYLRTSDPISTEMRCIGAIFDNVMHVGVGARLKGKYGRGAEGDPSPWKKACERPGKMEAMPALHTHSVSMYCTKLHCTVYSTVHTLNIAVLQTALPRMMMCQCSDKATAAARPIMTRPVLPSNSHHTLKFQSRWRSAESICMRAMCVNTTNLKQGARQSNTSSNHMTISGVHK